MKRIIVYGSVTGILALATTIYAVPTSATDSTDVVDQINITVPVSCSLTGTNLLHTTTIQNNQYKTDIGSATIKATCNDTNGLAIYAIGYTNEEDGNNKMHSSTLDSSYDIVTGKYVSGTTTNSVWSMKLTPVSGTYAPTIRNDATYNYTNYELIPAEYTKVAYRTTATDIGTGAQGANFTTNYAVYASTSQPAGTYTGKVKFTLVHPQNEVPAQPVACNPGQICYNPNSATALGEMGKQSAGNSAEVTLYASNFSRTGYGFAGWNTEYDYSGTTYGPNETITTPADTSTNGLSLYAVWVPSAGTLQNWNGCSGLAQGAVTALTDARDNDTYAVAKLADNKCWMIENLRLENTAEHNIDGTLSQGYNSSFIGLATPESANFSSATTANSLYSTDGTTTATISCNNQCYRFPRYNNNHTNSRQSSFGYSPNDNTYSMGNYYTWPAAIADTTYYDSGNHNTTSICPAGWHLPTGVATTGEFALLDIALGGTGNTSNSGTDPTGAVMSSRYRSYPNNFLYSGYFNGSSAGNRGSGGNYWSSTASGNYDSYNLSLYISGVYPGTYNYYKFNGLAVRCTLGS